MNNITILFALATIGILSSCSETNTTKTITVNYPTTNKIDHQDEYFGTVVKDPYQWLEDDNSAATKAWVEEENAVTQDYLSQIPYRNKIKERYSELFNYPKLTAPSRAGKYYFFGKIDGLQNQYVYYKQLGLDGEPVVFLDANADEPNGTMTYEIASISKDDKYAAIKIQKAGSDWAVIQVKNIETNEWTSDKIEWVKSSIISWYKDGFYYSRYPKVEADGVLSSVNENQAIYYHKLGTSQSEDKLVYDDKQNPKISNYAFVTEDDKYLVLYQYLGFDGNDIFVKDLSQSNSDFRPLFTGMNTHYSFVDNINNQFFILTDKAAPNYKLVKVDINQPNSNWTTIIPEQENVLEDVGTAGKHFFAKYLEKASRKIKQYDRNGKLIRDVELPGLGEAYGFNGEYDDEEVFYAYTSFNYPKTIFNYNIETGKSTLFHKSELKFNPEDFESKQVFYKSKDGTPVSMFLVYKKGLELDGNNPCFLYGYGGFNVNMTPYFSTSRIILLENGGVFAMPNLRGGGEYGEKWHKDGMLLNKQNVFDDFIAAGEYLIKEGYTSSEKLALGGGSNGGLLVGAVINQRPDLAAVAFPAVGVMDMLKYHQFTVGSAWVSEYGSSEQSKEMFEYLLDYSPYHNIKKGTNYPATMVETADHDDRVVPAHSFKYAARLQEYHEGPNPVLIRIGKSAGHGAGKSTEKIIQEQTDQWSFMFWNVGLEDVVGADK